MKTISYDDIKVTKAVRGHYLVQYNNLKVSVTNEGRKDWVTDYDGDTEELFVKHIPDFRYGIFNFETKFEAVHYAKCSIIEYIQLTNN